MKINQELLSAAIVSVLGTPPCKDNKCIGCCILKFVVENPRMYNIVNYTMQVNDDPRFKYLSMIALGIEIGMHYQKALSKMEERDNERNKTHP